MKILLSWWVKMVLLVLWVTSEVYAGIQRITSPNYERYSAELSKSFTGDSGMGFALGEWPVFIGFVCAIGAVVVFSVYLMFRTVVNARTVPKLVKYIAFVVYLYLFWIIITDQIETLLEIVKWSLYASIIPNMLFSAFSILAILEYWWFLFRAESEAKKA